MAFPDFFAAISSPALRAVAAHWNDVRGASMMPSWDDLKPSAIAGQLKMIWVFKYDAASREFTGRLAGERIANGFERNFRGTPLRELHGADVYPGIYKNAMRLVREPALTHCKGRLFRQRDRFGMGERIALPLSSDGVDCDGVIGASEYVYPVRDHAYGPVEILVQDERHFSLREAA
jgi:hypothetical protein